MKRQLGWLCVLLFQALPTWAQVEVKEVVTRPGVTLRFLYARAENAVASAVLFQGGGGNIGLFPNGSMRVEGFLSGGAKRFTDNGISVVIPDVPSDRRHLDNFRDTPEHAQDNAVLIDFLRQQAKLPVWTIGTSNGSLSAAAAAVHLKERGPDGVVLTASTTKPAPVGSGSHPVTAVALNAVKVPTLLVHHREDGCRTCPYEAMPTLMAALSAAPKVELISITGGNAQGNPCYSGHHQFLGIEVEVTRKIAGWIAAYQAPAK